MSNKRITDLTELTNPTTDDVFPVVDIATNTTTKVQLGNLPTTTAVTTALATKQATLVSGTNIKTVNSTSLVGSGNVAVQETLVSGTNIKTLNSTSLLGSGNIVLTANPSGVSGAIQFSNGSAFASDASNLFWDDTNNRLGVGTNAPNQQLQVVGKIGTSTLQIDSQDTLDRGNGLRYNYVSGSHILRFFTNSGTERLTILNDGSMGIGTSTPTARTHIVGSGSTSATTSLLVQNSSGVTGLTVFDNGNVSVGGSANSGYQLFGNGSWFNSGSIYTPLIYTSNISPASGGSTNLYGNANNFKIGTSATATASAVFEVDSTTKGVLFPRMTTTQKNAIATPAAGLVVYDSTTNKLCCYNGTSWNDLF